VLPITRTSFPCAATYSNVLRAVDAEQVRQVLMQALSRIAATQCCADEPSRLGGQREAKQHEHVALDGKTLRGTLGQEALDQQKMHQLALDVTQTGLLLKEQVTGEKQNELSIVSQFLTPLLVKGRIISADGLHTQHAFCLCVTRWDGDFGEVDFLHCPLSGVQSRLATDWTLVSKPSARRSGALVPCSSRAHFPNG
jgi:hypothetical protein